ncbi:DnaA ATPase domain-containing protein [Paenibacillus spongiae]|uniref:DnaA/Hda family protein n=1 Tax=Paenibacillus spongiae TaxID=2909671 RepID=A0ABY5SCD7_9BACL|nr:DnaA/Hda family protein [Paenibacillus spongiae]UVI31193.1 DnaA/Hda family protein [Paenibacillus spongiae]
MESMGDAMRVMLRKIEDWRTKTPSTTQQAAQTFGCVKCKDTGTINTFRWVEDEDYTYKGQPVKHQVAHVENCSCHFEKQLEKYNAAAGFSDKEREHTFKNAVIDDENRPNFEIAVDFIKAIDKHQQWGTWLYIYGDSVRAQNLADKTGKEISAYGTGKTYLMQCIANALTNRKLPAIYVNEEKLFGDIKSTYNRDSDESEQDVLRRYYTIPILLIDDLFSTQYTEWAEGKLFSILDARVNDKKITIITSNYATGRIEKRLPVNGGKIASRIMGQAQLVEMIGTDRRRTIQRMRKDETA